MLRSVSLFVVTGLLSLIMVLDGAAVAQGRRGGGGGRGGIGGGGISGGGFGGGGSFGSGRSFGGSGSIGRGYGAGGFGGYRGSGSGYRPSTTPSVGNWNSLGARFTPQTPSLDGLRTRHHTLNGSYRDRSTEPYQGLDRRFESGDRTPYHQPHPNHPHHPDDPWQHPYHPHHPRRPIVIYVPYWYPSPVWYGWYPFVGGYGGGYVDGAASYPVAYVQAEPEETVPPEGDQTEGDLYYAEAREAFLRKEYRQALKLAQHAAIEIPNEPKVHELTSLALFALGDYRGAAIAAHIAADLGPVADWPTLYHHYDDLELYTSQFRALQKYAADNPDSAPGQFLLGYHQMMMGHKRSARKAFARAFELEPQDKLAEELMQQLQEPPPTPGEEAKEDGE